MAARSYQELALEVRRPLTSICERLAGGTNRGFLRSSNEDAYAIATAPTALVVADGVGGFPAGEVASAIAVDAVSNVLGALAPTVDARGPRQVSAALLGAFGSAQRAVLDAQDSNPEWRGMATVMAAAVVVENSLCVCHCGDVRAYALQAGSVRRITADHSLVGRLLRDGVIDAAHARRHPQRNVILQAVGLPRDFAPEVGCLELEEDDKVLLCSDGLWDPVGDERIGSILTDARNASEAVEVLVEAALEAGGPDNVTVAVYVHRKRATQSD